MRDNISALLRCLSINMSNICVYAVRTVYALDRLVTTQMQLPIAFYINNVALSRRYWVGRGTLWIKFVCIMKRTACTRQKLGKSCIKILLFRRSFPTCRLSHPRPRLPSIILVVLWNNRQQFHLRKLFQHTRLPLSQRPNSCLAQCR